MSEIHFHKATTLSPEQFVAGLTDFGPERSKVFSKSAVWGGASGYTYTFKALPNVHVGHPAS